MQITVLDDFVLLKVGYVHKERAKSIPGWQWSPCLKSWVFPHNQVTITAICREFPEASIRTIEGGACATGGTCLPQEVTNLRECMAALQAETDQLRSANAELRQRLEKANTADSPLSSTLDAVRQIAVQVAQGDTEFADYVGRIPLDESLPLVLMKLVAGSLRGLLGTADRSLSVNDMLSAAERRKLLPGSATDAAHVIRRQRNLIAHESVAPETVPARASMSLLAAALYWRELPQAVVQAA